MAFRRLFRFSLRTFLVFITIVAVWLGMEVNRGRRQQAAIAAIQKMGGKIQYSYGTIGYTRDGIKTDAPAWLVKRMGDGFFGEVEIVDLTCNKSLTVEGMSSLADLRSIRELNLAGWSPEPTFWGGKRSGSSLSDTTLEPIAGLTTLVELDLARTKITDRGLKTVGTLTNLRDLDLAGCPRITDAGLREIKDLRLERLWLGGTPITGDGLVWIRNMKGLESLWLVGTLVSDSGLVHVGQLSRLKDLDLAHAKVTDDGLKHLTALSNLEHLDLFATRVSDSGLLHVGQLSGLRALRLEDTKITDHGLEHLTALSNLVDLDLSGTAVSDSGLVHVGQLSRLSFLDLRDTGVTDDGVEHLAALANLEDLYLTHTKVSDEAITHLRHLKSLRVLELNDTRVTSDGIARLRTALPGCPAIYGPEPPSLLERLLGL